MQLYAAFDEFRNVWPTTIRRTEEAAVLALAEEPGINPSDPLAGGMCIGSFGHAFVAVHGPSVSWVRGWLAPNHDYTSPDV